MLFSFFNSSSGDAKGQTEARTTHLEHWFSTGGDLMPPGDILQYLESFLVISYIYIYTHTHTWSFSGGSVVENLLAIQEAQI